MNTVIPILLASNPFFSAYAGSDFLGKLIFIGLFFLSIVSWVLIAYKWWMAHRIRTAALRFQSAYRQRAQQPLSVEYSEPSAEFENPFYETYQLLRAQTLEILNKNRLSRADQGSAPSRTYMSPADLELIEAHGAVAIAEHLAALEQHLFILPTIVNLAPLLGLLGTVWGITLTFSGLQGQLHSSGSQAVIGGISMALATTVLGLVVAIPALIGNSYLRYRIDSFARETDNFLQEVLNGIEMRYRKVDVE